MADVAHSHQTWHDAYTACRSELTRWADRELAAARICTGKVSGEDIVQMVFTQALGTGSEPEQPRAYLWKATRREVVRQIRLRRRQDAGQQADDYLAELCVEDFSDRTNQQVIVRQAVADLPRRQAEALWSTAVLGYTQQETATLMGTSPGTVAKHRWRASATLKKSLHAASLGLVAAAALLSGLVTRKLEPQMLQTPPLRVVEARDLPLSNHGGQADRPDPYDLSEPEDAAVRAAREEAIRAAETRVRAHVLQTYEEIVHARHIHATAEDEQLTAARRHLAASKRASRQALLTAQHLLLHHRQQSVLNAWG
ncbi:RNA polymerase sigma factor [Streptomyces massasporeus]|uniref:RNA polymerase sigma factor n=1 Tax=Streptomyces massasporeus TaxID=67324 RepID=UPI0036F57050